MKLTHINQYNTDKQNLEKTIKMLIKKIRYKWFDDYKCLHYKNLCSWEQNNRYWIQKFVKLTIRLQIILNIFIIQEFKKSAAESFESRLMSADLVNKTDFDHNLASFIKRITSNKTKHVGVQKKLNGLITKDYNFSSL